MEQTSEHRNKEEMLLDKLYNAQKLQKDAKQMCEGKWFPLFWLSLRKKKKCILISFFKTRF